MNKTLSIIYADTHDDSWGSTIEVFGIADNKEDIKKNGFRLAATTASRKEANNERNVRIRY